MKIIMTTLFGIEAITARELYDLGYEKQQVTVYDGQVVLDVGSDQQHIATAVARCNMFLTTAERVLLQVSQFFASDFDALFERTYQQPWEDWLTRGAEIRVKGYSRKSALFGIPACQSLIKKAIVRRLLEKYKMGSEARLEENPAIGSVSLQFGIVSNQVHLMIDTSGDGLHKRGYRPLMHEAPIKETLAAAMLKLVRFRPGFDEALVDPCCGSGTFLIEAAMLAAGMAPGLNRPFAGEQWPFIGSGAFDRARDEAFEMIIQDTNPQIQIFGSDLSPQAVEVSRSNARRAGVSKLISLKEADLTNWTTEKLREWTGFERMLILCNPPYGERLMDQQQADIILKSLVALGLEKGKPKPGCRLSVITPETRFERMAGGEADKRRKLYNGMIKCTFYQYFRQPYHKKMLNSEQD